MSHAQKVPKRKRRRKAMPMLGAASLSLANGASAAIAGAAADISTGDTGASHEIFSPKRKSLTLAWRHSTFSTKKLQEHSGPAYALPWAVAAALAVAAVAAEAAAAAGRARTTQPRSSATM